MKKQRTFSPEFKHQVVEELLSGVSTSAQLSRRHNISSGLIYHWKKQYAKGSFGNKPTHEAAQAERIRQLEQMVGRFTLENEFLKKALQNSLKQTEKRESSLPTITTLSRVPKGGANS
jgi:transposase